MKERENKRALLLTGGGAKGAFQVGALKHLINDLGRKYDLLTGYSVGALTSALLAQGELDNLIDVWEKIDSIGDVFSGNPMFYKGILTMGPLRKRLKEHLDISKLKNSDTKLIFIAVNLQTGELHECSAKSEPLIDWLLASAAIPGVVEPVKIGDYQYVDGGVLATEPLGPVVRENIDEVDVILCLPLHDYEEGAKYNTALDVIVRSLTIAQADIVKRDILDCIRINKALEQWEHLKDETNFFERYFLKHIEDKEDFPFKHFRHIKLNIIEPPKGLLGFLEFDKDKISKAMAAGYEKAVEVFG